jgi:hypothetical protein
MKKPFLLLLGDYHYPSCDIGDWKGCFETCEEILEQVTIRDVIVPKGIFNKQSFEFKGREYDWMEIVDLRDWTN